jgi:hypothetical protein
MTPRVGAREFAPVTQLPCRIGASRRLQAIVSGAFRLVAGSNLNGGNDSIPPLVHSDRSSGAPDFRNIQSGALSALRRLLYAALAL